MNPIRRNILSLLVLLLSWNACSEPPTPSLLYADRKIVDSLYQLEYQIMADSLDIACEKLQTESLDVVVDSLLKVRLVEIIKQKARYKQQQ
ncbi:MAG: hypothetical protein AAF847_20410 [Bacteroidota bacterium]